MSMTISTLFFILLFLTLPVMVYYIGAMIFHLIKRDKLKTKSKVKRLGITFAAAIAFMIAGPMTMTEEEVAKNKRYVEERSAKKDEEQKEMKEMRELELKRERIALEKENNELKKEELLLAKEEQRIREEEEKKKAEEELEEETAILKEEEQKKQKDAKEKELSQKSFYAIEVFPVTERIGKAYDKSWNDNWRTSFELAETDDIDTLTFLINIGQVSIDYKELISTVEGIDVSGLNNKQQEKVKKYKQNMIKSMNLRMEAVDIALDGFSSKDLSEEDVKKMFGHVDNADETMREGLYYLIELESELGFER